MRGTKRFFLSSIRHSELEHESTPFGTLRAACRRQSMRCYECNYKSDTHDTTYWLSNVEAVMRVEPSDGCPSSAELSSDMNHTPWLERCLACKHLAKQEEHWHKFEPDKWVFGR